MTRILIYRFIIYVFLCLCINSYTRGCETFPLTKTLSGIPKDCKPLHRFLCKKVLTGSSGQRNRFACALVIKTSTMSQKAIYINQIAQQTFEAKPDYYAKLAKKETMGEGEKSPITAAAGRLTLSAKKGTKKGTKNANESKLTSKLLYEMFENGAFVNADQIPLYCLEQENEKIKELIKNVRCFLPLSSITLMQRLFFSQASLFCEREKESAIYRCYNSDSELHALYVLQCMVDDIALKIASIASKDEKITAIEFHGCTTRDMCPLCYTNMNCMQFLANKKQGVGFLGALLERLKMIGRADNSTNSATFISSLEEFPSKKDGDGGNLLWVTEDEPVFAIEPGFVYQFRFTEPEITAIKGSLEESLKIAASITDLSSLGVSLGGEAASAVVAPPKPFTVSSGMDAPSSPTEVQETISEELVAAGYRIQDVPGDGNCAFWAVLVANGVVRAEDTFFAKEGDTTWGKMENLRKKTAVKMEATHAVDASIITMVKQTGSWNMGSMGGIDFGVLGFIARAIEVPIMVLLQGPSGQYCYWISGTTENPGDDNLAFHDIEGKNLEKLLNDHSKTVKLFHSNIHYQAIVKQ